MRGLVVLPLIAVLGLAACDGRVPSPEQRASNDLNQSGRPYVGPAITRVTTPPGDINTLDPLNCHPEGQGSVCDRPDRGTTTSAASSLW